MLNKKLKGFTMTELMVTLALTGMMTTFAYLAYSNIDKLLQQFNEQSQFITAFNELSKRLTNLSMIPGKIVQKSENKFIITSDSSEYVLQFNTENIVIGKVDVMDTFKIKPINIKCEPEPGVDMEDNMLINHINFDFYFQKQKFGLKLSKKYDGYSKLARELKTN